MNRIDPDAAAGAAEPEYAEPVLSERDRAGAADTLAAEAGADRLLFVTPDGAWVRDLSEEFFAALGDPEPDYDAGLFAVKNLGFIGIRVSGKSIVGIELHPKTVSGAALASVQYLLPSMQGNLFKINYLQECWKSEATSSAAEAICRLSEICVLEGAGITRPTAVVAIH